MLALPFDTMTGTGYAVALATLSLLASGGCNSGGPPAASPAEGAVASGETVIRVEDDSKSFDVPRGATVTFKLTSNAGTGYLWTPTQVDPAILTQQGDRSSEVSSDAPGAPKLDVYHFTAGTAGSTAVEMSLKRPFGTAPAARAIHVTVTVH